MIQQETNQVIISRQISQKSREKALIAAMIAMLYAIIKTIALPSVHLKFFIFLFSLKFTNIQNIVYNYSFLYLWFLNFLYAICYTLDTTKGKGY